MSSTPPTSPPWRRSAPPWKARPSGSKIPIPQPRSPTPLGCVPGSAAGPAIMASPDQWSPSTACSDSKQWPTDGTSGDLCESSRDEPGGEEFLAVLDGRGVERFQEIGGDVGGEAGAVQVEIGEKEVAADAGDDGGDAALHAG